MPRHVFLKDHTREITTIDFFTVQEAGGLYRHYERVAA